MTNLRAYAQLVRLPNVFTAVADIGMAGLASGALLNEPSAGAWWALGCLLAASACLYCAGMVWNDVFDVEQDRQERPHRPLPAGRVRRKDAIRFGAVLLAAGLSLAALAGWDDYRLRTTPLVLAGLLAAAILLYDGWLKGTWLGPMAMGACRFLNVLLGLSVVPGPFRAWGLGLALCVGVYIAGVTWFARTEARTSNRDALIAAAMVMLAGLLQAFALPVLAAGRPEPVTTSPLFPYLLVAYGFAVGLPLVRAINHPSPVRVQAAVKTAVLGLIAFDAILATALAGNVGLILLILLLPAVYLGRWLYST
jgi:4-hydroxybenzoate polyprenyltransferase